MPADEVARLRAAILEGCRRDTHLQEAAQHCAGILYEQLQSSAVLVRVYATQRLAELPAEYKAFAEQFAYLTGDAGVLRPQMPVLCLLGSRGDLPHWNDPGRSRGHLAIPLVSARFVERIPMVARLMHDMGLGLDWLDTADADIVVEKLGAVAGVFHVEDAATEVDSQGRLIVPAQDFVAAHEIHTVFGLGGTYLSGMFVSFVVFTRETFPRARTQAFATLLTAFKNATRRLAANRAVFSARE